MGRLHFCGTSSFCSELLRVRPRFFDQVAQKTMYASILWKLAFFTKSCHHMTYQNYEKRQQKLDTILGNKASQKFQKYISIKIGLLVEFSSKKIVFGKIRQIFNTKI